MTSERVSREPWNGDGFPPAARHTTPDTPTLRIDAHGYVLPHPAIVRALRYVVEMAAQHEQTEKHGRLHPDRRELIRGIFDDLDALLPEPHVGSPA